MHAYYFLDLLLCSGDLFLIYILSLLYHVGGDTFEYFLNHANNIRILPLNIKQGSIWNQRYMARICSEEDISKKMSLLKERVIQARQKCQNHHLSNHCFISSIGIMALSLLRKDR